MAVDNIPFQTKSYYTNIQHVRIHYEKYDHPTPNGTFVFIHGFLSSTLSFKSILPLITKSYSVIALDLPGFGKSEKSLTFYYSYHNFGSLIIELLKRLDVAKAIIVGHSMGGQIALHVAKQAPCMVEKLVLIGSSGYLRKARKAAICCSYLPFFSVVIEQWFKRKDIYKSFLDIFHDERIITEELIDGYLKPYYDKDFFKGLTRLLRHREGDMDSTELGQISTPTLIIWGREDRSVPLHIGYRLQKDLPNAKMIIMDGAGHLPSEERPFDFYHELVEGLSYE